MYFLSHKEVFRTENFAIQPRVKCFTGQRVIGIALTRERIKRGKFVRVPSVSARACRKSLNNESSAPRGSNDVSSVFSASDIELAPAHEAP